MKLEIRSREIRLLRLAAEGSSLEEISRKEGISKKETEQELKMLYRKLSCSNALEALQVLAKKEFRVVD